jgi:hypothetical protein
MKKVILVRNTLKEKNVYMGETERVIEVVVMAKEYVKVQ